MAAPTPEVRMFSYTANGQLIRGTAVLLANTLTLCTEDGESFQAMLGPMPNWVRLTFAFAGRNYLPSYWIADASQVPSQRRNQFVHFKLASELTKVMVFGATEVIEIAQSWLEGLNIPRPAGNNFNPTGYT